MVKNTMEFIKAAEVHMDGRYDIRFRNLQDIYVASKNPYDLIRYGFLFGYLQGRKAERTGQKK